MMGGRRGGKAVIAASAYSNGGKNKDELCAGNTTGSRLDGEMSRGRNRSRHRGRSASLLQYENIHQS